MSDRPAEVRLPGGNVDGAVRVGDTVRRLAGPWTPAVHSLLEHPAASGLDAIPTIRGTDEQGREVLSYLPGRSIDVDTEIVGDALLADGVAWLRRFHDAVASFRPSGPVRWRNGTWTMADDQIICHHDPGPYNWIVDDDRLVGVIDWDMAAPGTPLDDLAFMAWNAVPLFRPVPAADAAHRLTLMAGGYGGVEPAVLLGHVGVRMRRALGTIEAGQRRGDPGMLNLARVGEPARTRGRLDLMETRFPEFTAYLD